MSRIGRFNGIIEFLAVARHGSFTAAAASLGLSKSAVGKSLSRLEQRLGVRLFHRTTRRLSLTADGEVYLETCLATTAGLDAAEEAIGIGLGTVSGRLRIDLPNAFGRLYVVPILIDLMRRYPDLMIGASFTDRRVDIIEEGLDLAVRIGAPPDTTELVACRLGVQTLVVCGAPSYLAAHGTPMHKGDLSAHRCISGWRNWPPQAWPRKGPSERHSGSVHHELGDGEAMLAAVLAGQGLAQLPTWLAGAHLRSGALVPVLPGLSDVEMPISAIWPRSRHLLPKTRVTVDALLRGLSGLPA